MSSDVLHFEMERFDDEDGIYYVVSGVEIALVTDGPTPDEAYSNLKKAVKLYFEPEPIPPFKVKYIGSRLQCPCCDYLTKIVRGGYNICPVCFWEDDGQDIDELDYISGPNHITLREARANFLKIGAVDERVKQWVIPEDERTQYEYRPRDIA